MSILDRLLSVFGRNKTKTKYVLLIVSCSCGSLAFFNLNVIPIIKSVLTNTEIKVVDVIMSHHNVHKYKKIKLKFAGLVKWRPFICLTTKKCWNKRSLNNFQRCVFNSDETPIGPIRVPRMSITTGTILSWIHTSTINGCIKPYKTFNITSANV